jgi:hypothetical protein
MPEGGCFCGAIRYATTDDIAGSAYCHCSICRGTTGAPFVAWFSVPAKHLRWLAGSPATIRSSDHGTRTFCAACGTQLTFVDDTTPDEVDVTNGSLDDPARIAPTRHIFTRSKLAWVTLADGLPQFLGSSSDC